MFLLFVNQYVRIEHKKMEFYLNQDILTKILMGHYKTEFYLNCDMDNESEFIINQGVAFLL